VPSVYAFRMARGRPCHAGDSREDMDSIGLPWSERVPEHWPGSRPPYAAADRPFPDSLTETSFETPGSSIVTP
jgi:hypothetical protein